MGKTTRFNIKPCRIFLIYSKGKKDRESCKTGCVWMGGYDMSEMLSLCRHNLKCEGHGSSQIDFDIGMSKHNRKLRNLREDQACDV